MCTKNRSLPKHPFSPKTPPLPVGETPGQLKKDTQTSLTRATLPIWLTVYGRMAQKSMLQHHHYNMRRATLQTPKTKQDATQLYIDKLAHRPNRPIEI